VRARRVAPLARHILYPAAARLELGVVAHDGLRQDDVEVGEPAARRHSDNLKHPPRTTCYSADLKFCARSGSASAEVVRAVGAAETGRSDAGPTEKLNPFGRIPWARSRTNRTAVPGSELGACCPALHQCIPLVSRGSVC